MDGPESPPFSLSSRAVGTLLPIEPQVITQRRAMAFAAGIAAERAGYFSGSMVPPGLLAALEWPVVNGAAYRRALGADQEQMQRAIHVRQASVFRRPFHIGQAVETRGRIVGMRQTRGGVLVATRLTTCDNAGRLLATSLFVTLTNGAGLLGEPHSFESIAAPTRAATGPFSVAATLSIPAALPHLYTECAQIWNPIHTEAAAARRAGLPGIILHGSCTWAMALERAIDAFAGGDPARLYAASADFVGPVFPGSILEVAFDAGSRRATRHALRIRSGADTVMSGEVGVRQVLPAGFRY